MSLTESVMARARDVLTGVASVVALVAAAAYVATPAQSVLAIALHSTNVRVPAGHETIYGTALDAAGKPISGLRIVIARRTRAGLSPVVSFTTGKSGAIRANLTLRAGSYVLEVSWKRSGSIVRGSATLKLQPGHAYSLTIRQRHSGGLFILPVRGY